MSEHVEWSDTEAPAPSAPAAVTPADAADAARLVAFGLQTVFLALFLGRLAMFGMTSSRPHDAAGWARYSLLVGHEAISVPTIALVLAALALGLGGRRHEHREVAKMAAPLWLVSMTSGVVVYVLVHVLGL